MGQDRRKGHAMEIFSNMVLNGSSHIISRLFKGRE
jgi:hypothetical protein